VRPDISPGARCSPGRDGDRDRGSSHLLSPPTPPDKRVRIRRFDELLPYRTGAGGAKNAPPMVVSPLVEFPCRLHPLLTRSSPARRLIGWRMATHETRFSNTPSHRSGLRSPRNCRVGGGASDFVPIDYGPVLLLMPFGFLLAMDTLPSANPTSFRAQPVVTPAFGYGSPHLGARGTSTLLNHALLSAHYALC
jgi:hypothetical protein